VNVPSVGKESVSPFLCNQQLKFKRNQKITKNDLRFKFSVGAINLIGGFKKRKVTVELVTSQVDK
jgi:hypothetical protein